MAKDIFEEMEEDALETTVTSDADLKTLSVLVEEQLEMEDTVAQLESALKDMKEKLQHHKTRTVPEHMNAIGTGLWRSNDGTVVELKSFVSASIPKDKKEEAYRWLTDHGHGDLIKSEVSVLFGKEELENAEKLMKKLEKDGYSFDSKQSVHASTLKSWLAGQVEAAEPVPLELFGAFLGQVATIKKGR